MKKKIEEGTFRADLFFRINVFPIEIPTLSERKDDIPILVEFILNEISKNQLKPPKFDVSALRALQEYIWPGNIRELRNVIERAAIIFPGSLINSENVKKNLIKNRLPKNKEEKEGLWDMTSDLTQIDNQDKINPNESTINQIPHPKHYKKWFDYLDKIDLRRHLSEIEINLIEASLLKNKGSVTKSAESLKINRTTLIEKMKKLSIQKSFD